MKTFSMLFLIVMACILFTSCQKPGQQTEDLSCGVKLIEDDITVNSATIDWEKEKSNIYFKTTIKPDSTKSTQLFWVLRSYYNVCHENIHLNSGVHTLSMKLPYPFDSDPIYYFYTQDSAYGANYYNAESPAAESIEGFRYFTYSTGVYAMPEGYFPPNVPANFKVILGFISTKSNNHDYLFNQLKNSFSSIIMHWRYELYGSGECKSQVNDKIAINSGQMFIDTAVYHYSFQYKYVPETHRAVFTFVTPLVTNVCTSNSVALSYELDCQSIAGELYFTPSMLTDNELTIMELQRQICDRDMSELKEESLLKFFPSGPGKFKVKWVFDFPSTGSQDQDITFILNRVIRLSIRYDYYSM